MAKSRQGKRLKCSNSKANAHNSGVVAQLGERMTGSHEVRGSIPLSSTRIYQSPSKFLNFDGLLLPDKGDLMEDNKQVYNFYEKQFDEDKRFLPNPLECIRAKDIIARYLEKAPLSIADIGGANGLYSYWLAEKGHEVHLLDLSDKHILLAKNYGKNNGITLSSLTCGDARQLPYEDGKFDMALNMGPLYHLQENSDRIQCLKEVYRVLKVGGRAIFAYISRFASLIDGYKYHFLDDPDFQKIVENDLQSGKHDNCKKIPHYFTTAFFHTPNLILDELQHCAFTDIQLFAVEGFASILDTDNIMKDEKKKELLLRHLRYTEQSDELLGISSHIMAVCSKSL